MGPAFYILAILGCGEGETACQQITTAGSSYESVDACNRASEGVLMNHVDAAFPVVVAQCQRSDNPAAGKVWADEVERPGPEEVQGKPRIQRARYLDPRRLRS
jgi:hypothetical protein